MKALQNGGHPRLGAGAYEKRLQILNALRATPGMSKVQLARRLGISPTTAGALVADLVGAGVVVRVGFGLSTGGRPPERLDLNPERPLAMGVDLGETDVRMGVFNLAGKRLDAVRAPFRRRADRVRLEPILSRARELLGRHPGVGSVGLAVPGIVDREAGVVREARNLGWLDLDLAGVSAGVLRRPVTIDRNTSAALLGEEWWGSASDADPIVLVTLGSGVGAAIRIDGKVLAGASNSAGQFGHILGVPDGPVCGCGKRGCLESVASSRALVRRYSELSGGTVARRTTVRAIATAARSGEAAAVRALNEVAERLGLGLVSLVNLVNPAEIVLGGELMDAEDIVLPVVRSVLLERALALATGVLRITVSTFHDEAPLVGAAALAFESLFAQVSAGTPLRTGWT